jgi:hypothetical protein
MKRTFFSRFCFPGVYILLALILLFTLSVDGTHAAKVGNVPATDFKDFVGSWVRHGAGLQFNADGSGSYSERVYQWCGPGIQSPCDSFQGNTIISGDTEKMQFTRSKNNIAYGKVTSSTMNDVGLDVTLTYTATNDTIRLTSPEGHFATPRLLCGPGAAVGLCGA